MRAIKKCSNCNDYGVSYNYMTQYATDKKQFCSCPFGQFRKKEFVEFKCKKCGRKKMKMEMWSKDLCNACNSGYDPKPFERKLLEKKLKKMAGL